MMRRKLLLTAILALFATGLTSQSLVAQSDDSAAPLVTWAEKTDYHVTTPYQQTLEFIRQLEAGSNQMRVEEFGRSPQGRPMVVAVLGQPDQLTAEAARESGKPIVLISNGIHSGEICGKEASLMLMREILTGNLNSLLDNMIILILPVYNVDGHEMSSPHSRIGQDGPQASQGYRATSLGYDLNRDFMKVDSVEASAWIGNLFTKWWPHLTIDTHTTDGYDHQADLGYRFERWPDQPPELNAFLEQMLSIVSLRMGEAEYKGRPFGGFADNDDPSRGWVEFPPYARLCTGYVAAHGRLALLSEAHSRKNFKTRVLATYEFLKASLQYVSANASKTMEVVESAARITVQKGKVWGDEDWVPLQMRPVPSGENIQVEGWKMDRGTDEATGLSRIIYTRIPQIYDVPLINKMEVTESISRPVAYIIPREYQHIANKLLLHGIRVEQSTKQFAHTVEVYKIKEMTFDDPVYQGHLRASVELSVKKERRDFTEGTFIVPMTQPSARLAALLLEPRGPDSLLSWNHLNMINTERKVRDSDGLKLLAIEMMSDPDIQAEFQREVDKDPEFFKDERRKLNFFWERSPYKDELVGEVPIFRATTAPKVPTKKATRD